MSCTGDLSFTTIEKEGKNKLWKHTAQTFETFHSWKWAIECHEIKKNRVFFCGHSVGGGGGRENKTIIMLLWMTQKNRRKRRKRKHFTFKLFPMFILRVLLAYKVAWLLFFLSSFHPFSFMKNLYEWFVCQQRKCQFFQPVTRHILFRGHAKALFCVEFIGGRVKRPSLRFTCRMCRIIVENSVNSRVEWLVDTWNLIEARSCGYCELCTMISYILLIVSLQKLHQTLLGLFNTSRS